MGGHGGLNILPQKRWNVYNFDNREKVRKDEEAAAKEEQLKREQSRRRDTEFRLQKLREARGLAAPPSSSASESLPESKSNNHMNLFEGIKIFDPVGIEEGDEKMKGSSSKRMKKEVAPKVILPEDEKYRLGYGVAGKGVKLPWYMAKRNDDDSKVKDSGDGDRSESDMVSKRSSGKKSLEELRNERMKREKTEKERERALLLDKRRHVGSGNARR